MKRITVLTLQNIRNYGSVLQALATQELFERLGCKVDFINYLRPDMVSTRAKLRRHCAGDSFAKKFVKSLVMLPTLIKQDFVYKKFIKKYLNVQPTPMTTAEDFAKMPIESDIYCTGSDQTWNSGWNEGLVGALFLNFVPDGVKKIAYSASIGKNKLDDWEVDETRRMLSRYDAISVRESTAVDIIKGLGIDATHVLDPTLQMNRDFWMSIASPQKETGYVLIYQLNASADFDRYANEVARRKGLKLLRLCFTLSQARFCGKAIVLPKVEDFISYIAHADCVITDSFHATAFSINLNTPFIAIYPPHYGSRLSSLLELTGLQDRHLTQTDDFTLVENLKMDFTHANEVLEKEREKGLAFVKQAIAD